MLQTLIKLERWSDALDFCDRALHVDGTCVKALSRRASAFVNLAGKCLAASINATATAAAAAADTVTAAPTAAATAAYTVAESTRVVSPSTIGIEVGESKGDTTGVSASTSSLLNRASREAVGVGGGGAETAADDEDDGDGGTDQALYGRFGGRQGLLALALVDLEAAVQADPESEDVRRQRDALKTEIDEEKVIVPGH